MSGQKQFFVTVSVNHGIVCGGVPYKDEKVNPEAKLVVNPQTTVQNGAVAVGELNGELVVKRYYNQNGNILLVEPGAEPINLKETDKFEILGRAVQVRVSYL